MMAALSRIHNIKKMETLFSQQSFSGNSHGWNTQILKKEIMRETFSDKFGNVRPYSQHNQSYSQFKKRK